MRAKPERGGGEEGGGEGGEGEGQLVKWAEDKSSEETSLLLSH